MSPAGFTARRTLVGITRFTSDLGEYFSDFFPRALTTRMRFSGAAVRPEGFGVYGTGLAVDGPRLSFCFKAAVSFVRLTSSFPLRFLYGFRMTCAGAPVFHLLMGGFQTATCTAGSRWMALAASGCCVSREHEVARAIWS